MEPTQEELNLVGTERTLQHYGLEIVIDVLGVDYSQEPHRFSVRPKRGYGRILVTRDKLKD